MMLGSGNPTPFDEYALVALCVLATALLVGCILGPRWVSQSATVVRWGALVLATLIVAALLVVTPSSAAVVAAGRLFTLWPATIAVIFLFLVWSWRLGHF
jgi:hypothetical protein